MKVLVSACLLGINCKYNGGNNYNAQIVEYLKDKEVVPICPEVLGKMTTPRPSAEIKHGIVYDELGNNIDAQFRHGVLEAMQYIKDLSIDCVILQSRSPSCGVTQVYDGTFSGNLIAGSGLFAQACIEAGYTVIDASAFK